MVGNRDTSIGCHTALVQPDPPSDGHHLAAKRRKTIAVIPTGACDEHKFGFITLGGGGSFPLGYLGTCIVVEFLAATKYIYLHRVVGRSVCRAREIQHEYMREVLITLNGLIIINKVNLYEFGLDQI